MECYLRAGSAADTTGLRAMALRLPDGNLCYPDAAYTDYTLANVFAEATGGQQQTARKVNRKRPHSPTKRFMNQYLCKDIEITFSQLTTRFPQSIHAVTAAGFV